MFTCLWLYSNVLCVYQRGCPEMETSKRLSCCHCSFWEYIWSLTCGNINRCCSFWWASIGSIPWIWYLFLNIYCARYKMAPRLVWLLKGLALEIYCNDIFLKVVLLKTLHNCQPKNVQKNRCHRPRYGDIWVAQTTVKN